MRPERCGYHPSRRAFGAHLRVTKHSHAHPFSRCDRIRVLPSHGRIRLHINEGRRSAGRRNVLEPRHTIRCCHLTVLSGAAAALRGRSPLGAPPRHSPSFDPRLNSGPRFLELPGANGRTLPGASAASTSRTGPSAGRGYEARPRGDRARSIIGRHRLTPLPEQAGLHVTISGTDVNRTVTAGLPRPGTLLGCRT